MQKLIVVSLESPLDLEHFNESVQSSISTSSLKPMLFKNLYQRVSESHSNNHLRIWGVPRGHKSSLANKWNQINEGDVCVFLANGILLGYSKVQIKFQSETIASQLWPRDEEDSTRQYLFTLSDLFSFSSELALNSLKLWKKAKFDVPNFEVLDGAKATEFISSLYFPSDSASRVDESQTFGLDSAQKKAIELHAVATAINFLRDKGYSEIEDVGSIHSYDLHATGPAGRLHVEVKGTTGDGAKVILTRNEVAFQKSCFPENALVIVNDIKISFEGELRASGGKITFISPWKIDETDLAPISFEYSV